MKKDRNAFFESSQVTSSFTQPTMPQMPQSPQMAMGFNQQQVMPVPYQAASNTSSFYAGGVPLNTFPGTTIDTTDYDTKLSRMERQIQKLEARVSKLESASLSSTSTDDINVTSNMYML